MEYPYDPERIAYLIAGFLGKTLTEEEHDELDRWVEASEENMKLFAELTDEENIEAALAWYAHKEKNQEQRATAMEAVRQKAGIKSRKPLTARLLPFAIAAMLIVVLGLVWLNNSRKEEAPPPIAVQPKKEAQPGTNKAVLTLSDGRMVVLDSSIRRIAEGATIRQAGEVFYGEEANTEGKYNQIDVPRGGEYKVVLSDGTAVWLNAESRLRYPVQFGPGKRRVELSGEAYFEVKSLPANHDKSVFEKFLVVADGMEVEVLGTRFNIHAYKDENDKKTTLVEGSVRLRTNNKEKLLRPGEEALVSGDKLVINETDAREATAWKDGLFIFRDAPIEAVANQLMRWYDLQVVYEGKVNDLFTATVGRDEELERLLKVLQTTGQVQFTLRGNRLTIKP